MEELLSLSDEYDIIFMEELLPALESLITIQSGIWQPSDTAVPQWGKMVKDRAASIIVDGVAEWLTADGANENDHPRIADYYIRGIELWALNQELLGKRPPRKIRLEPAEIDRISGYLSEFTNTWQDHLDRHCRAMRRFAFTATMEGWTTERFIDAVTAPDGHIVGFRYGNASYSWHEHLRRFGKGKMRMLAQVAQERRM